MNIEPHDTEELIAVLEDKGTTFDVMVASQLQYLQFIYDTLKSQKEIEVVEVAGYIEQIQTLKEELRILEYESDNTNISNKALEEEIEQNIIDYGDAINNTKHRDRRIEEKDKEIKRLKEALENVFTETTCCYYTGDSDCYTILMHHKEHKLCVICEAKEAFNHDKV